MKKYTLSGGQSFDYKHPAPERTAGHQMGGMNFDVVFQVWPNRPSMARSIRMQERRAPMFSDWRPVVKLSDSEGY